MTHPNENTPEQPALDWIQDPLITQVPETNAAVVRMRIAKTDMQAEMPKAIGEVFTALAAQGIQATGPLFAKYYSVDGDHFDFEVGFPTSETVKTKGRVHSSPRAGGHMYHATYIGDYQNLGEAWGEFDAWIAKQSAAASEHLWEIYWTDPGQEPDPTKWRTGMYREILR